MSWWEEVTGMVGVPTEQEQMNAAVIAQRDALRQKHRDEADAAIAASNEAQRQRREDAELERQFHENRAAIRAQLDAGANPVSLLRKAAGL